MRVVTLLLGLLVVAAAVASGQVTHTTGQSSLPPSVARFLNNPVESLTQFVATRHLEAPNTRFKKRGWMDVITELSASDEIAAVR